MHKLLGFDDAAVLSTKERERTLAVIKEIRASSGTKFNEFINYLQLRRLRAMLGCAYLKSEEDVYRAQGRVSELDEILAALEKLQVN
jgi:hypothetical protein